MSVQEEQFILLAENKLKDYQILLNQLKLYTENKSLTITNLHAKQQLIDTLFKINELLQINNISECVNNNYKHLQIKEI